MRSEDYATTQRRLAMADVLAELPEEVITARSDPSAGRVRLTPPICTMGEDTHFTQFEVLATLGNGRHLMMGDDPPTPEDARPTKAGGFLPAPIRAAGGEPPSAERKIGREGRAGREDRHGVSTARHCNGRADHQ